MLDSHWIALRKGEDASDYKKTGTVTNLDNYVPGHIHPCTSFLL